MSDVTIHLHEITIKAEQLMSAHFQNHVKFSRIDQISEPRRRNLLLRLWIDNPSTTMPQSIILKKTDIESSETDREQMSRFARDWAGIEFLTKVGGHHGPDFYAGSLEHKFILIEDLGENHSSLVGPLTKTPSLSNRLDAEDALMSYVDRLGKMHAQTAGKLDLFNSILNKIYPQTLRIHFLKESDIALVLEQLTQLLGKFSTKLNNELQEIYDFAKSPNDFSVLLHGDICPDNVFYENNQMRFIDFEYSDFGHALIDAVYLRMCMPSCWCSKAVPDAIRDRLEIIYRNQLKTKLTVTDNDSLYTKQLVYACAYWIIRCIRTLADLELINHEYICPSGPVDADSIWEPEKNAFRPRILSRLKSFTTLAEATAYLPNFTSTCFSLLTKLKTTWPYTNLIDLFPVFK